jgi:hypothetical protein
VQVKSVFGPIKGREVNVAESKKLLKKGWCKFLTL